MMVIRSKRFFQCKKIVFFILYVWWTSQNSNATNPSLDVLSKKAIGFHPRLYVSNNIVLPKDQCHSGEVHVNVKQLMVLILLILSKRKEVKCHGFFYT